MFLLVGRLRLASHFVSGNPLVTQVFSNTNSGPFPPGLANAFLGENSGPFVPTHCPDGAYGSAYSSAYKLPSSTCGACSLISVQVTK